MWRSFFLMLLFCGVSVSPFYGQASIYYLQWHSLPYEEDSLAVDWLKRSNLDFSVIDTTDIAGLSASNVLWIHAPAAGEVPSLSSSKLTALNSFYEKGGKLLYTGAAGYLPVKMGIETTAPETRPVTISQPEFYEKRGLQSYRGHPVFQGLFGGSYIFQPTESLTVWRTGYFNQHPEQGKIVAIEKAYVRFLPDTILVWEYKNKQGGKILNIGAYVYFSPRNFLHDHMERLLHNSFAYLMGEIQEPISYWPSTPPLPPQSIAPPASRLGIPRATNRLLEGVKWRQLQLKQEPATMDPWDIGGRETLITGKQKMGIQEIWAFPYRIVQGYTISLIHNGKHLPLDSFPVEFVQFPEAIERTYKTPLGELTEIIFAHLNKPGVVLHYQWKGKASVQLQVQFSTDLRWFWPYREDARARLQYAFDEKRQAFYFRTADEAMHVFIGGDIPPLSHVVGQFLPPQYKDGQWQVQPASADQIAGGAVYALNAKNDFCLNLAIAAGLHSAEQANAVYRAMLANPLDILSMQQSFYDSLFTHSIQMESPDKTLNEAYQWALVALNRFKMRTPGVGTGLMAGFGTTERGWDGGHKVSGRPGYAWYFGRDAVWAAFPFLANGDTLTLKQQLRLFCRFQDLSGKIFHELTPGGVVHFDAADATPLFVILTGQFLRSSGDTAFLKEMWPHVMDAMQFLERTDTDGDGLINNYQVGHGWVEGGPLFGGKTTFYLAGLWQVALQEAAYLARLMHEEDVAGQWARQAARVYEKLQNTFYLPDKQFFAHHIDFANVPFAQMSILPAAVMNLLPFPGLNLKKMQMAFASTAFTADWGVRILSQYSPMYHPKGYHSGSVWPLFTGWLILAQYHYGHALQGAYNLIQMAQLHRKQALGYIEEVYDGDKFDAIGVCPHQAWSESALLNPIYYGLLGLQFKGTGDTLRVSPQLPGNWRKLVVRNINVGGTRFDLQIQQGEKNIEYKIFNVQGAPKTVVLKGRIPQGARLKKVSGVPRDISFQLHKDGSLTPEIPLTIQAKRTIKIKFHFQGGVAFFPAATPLHGGQKSHGLRILDIQQQGNTFYITVEVKGGHDYYLGVRTFRQKIKPIKGAFLTEGLKRGDYWLQVLTPKFVKDYIQKTVVVQLQD